MLVLPVRGHSESRDKTAYGCFSLYTKEEVEWKTEERNQ